MSDSSVDALLKKWGVGQLSDRCKEQEVDLEALRSLKEDVIAELVPHIGPRCKFLKGWRRWRDAGAPTPAADCGPAQLCSSPGPVGVKEHSRCLGVYGLGSATSEQQLHHIFSKYGPVERVNIIIDAKSGRSRGFSHVYFESHESARAAKEQCAGLEIDGRRIRVDFSQSNPDELCPSPSAGLPATPSPAPSGPSSPGAAAGDTPEHAVQGLPPLSPSATATNLPGPSQNELNEYPTADRSARKEVSVVLEGKITYEDDEQSGWLSASGFLGTSDGEAGHNLTWEKQSIKSEPVEGNSTNSYNGRRRPKFTLQGRISLSAQDFMQVPSFMLQEHTPSACYDGSEAQMQGYQDSDMLAAIPSSSSTAPSAGARPVQPLPQDILADIRRMQTVANRSKRSRSEKIDLEALLNSSSKGKMVLSLYNQRGCLDGPARQTLTDLIIAEELREDLNRRITSQRFQEIAEAIVELFPCENEDTYFSNDRSYGDRPGGKGKLTSKYYNTRRQLAKSGVICRGHKERRQLMQQGGALVGLQMNPMEEQTAQHSMEWLQSLEWPVPPSLGEVVLEKWRGCWKPRMQRVLSQGHLPAAYLEDFPVLQSPLGSVLISSDFDMLLKNAGNRLLNDWPTFSHNVITILADDYRKQLPLLDHVKKDLTTEEGRQVGALLLLTNMLPVTTCKGSGESAELWRPTRQEAQDGFLLHVERQSDWYAALENHRSRMRLMGQLVSPLPIIVGKSLDALEVAMVALENTTFVVPSALHAVDLCFKCFHALQVPYPPQAQNAWLFLQHAVYQVAVPTDRMSVAVSSLLADFGFRPVPPVISWDQVLL